MNSVKRTFYCLSLHWATVCFYFIKQACSRRCSQGTQGAKPPKIFVIFVFLCFKTRYPKQNTILLLKSNICPPFCAPTNFSKAPRSTRKVFVGVQKQYWWNVKMGVRRKFSRGGKSTICILFKLLTMQCKWTFIKRFTLFTPQRECIMFRQLSQKCGSFTAMLLFHSCT